MAECEIRKGGRLFTRRFKSEEEWSDRTDRAPRHLFDSCTLEEGVTLRDIFLLLNSNLEVFDLVLGNWTRELTEEALNQPPVPSDLKYLFLEWAPSIQAVWDGRKETDKKHFSGNFFPDFHGWGPIEEGGKTYDTRWGVSTCSVNSIIDTPLVLKEAYSINDEMAWWKKFRSRGEGEGLPNRDEFIVVYDKCDFTLGHILYGIVWELSWHGGPKQREEFNSEINRRIDEINDGTAELIPLEEVLSKLQGSSEE